MTSRQRIGFLAIVIGNALFFIFGMALFSPGPFLIGLFLAPIGAFAYSYPVWMEYLICPDCGAKNKAPYKICSSCGQRPFVAFYASEVATVVGVVYSKREYVQRIAAYAFGMLPILVFFVVIDLWPITLSLVAFVVLAVSIQYRKAVVRQRPDYDGSAEQLQLVVDEESGELIFKKV